jgi:hypothetical protein
MTSNWIKITTGIKTLLLAVGLTCLTQSLAAQSPDRSITLSGTQITVAELFREIERQTGNVVVVRANTVDDSQTLNLPSREGTLNEILGGLLADTGKEWHISEGYIIIGEQPQAPKAQVQPAPQPQAERPIIIAKDELKQLVPAEGRMADTIIYRTIEAGPFRFGVGDQTFRTPGRLTPNGEVVAPFTTAERWQRSKLVLKTNLLYGLGTLTPNLRGELGLGNRTTLELGVAYNGWNLEGSIENNRKLVHGIAMAEFRYWLCERFEGHYFGLHGFGGFYNVSGHDIPLLFEKEFRYEGQAYGAGISYGYMLPLSPRWGVEFNVGVGAAILQYDKYGCEKCDDLEGTYKKTYFGPTRAAINLVFIIR